MAKFTVHVWIAPLSELNKSDCAHETRTLAAIPRLACPTPFPLFLNFKILIPFTVSVII